MQSDREATEFTSDHRWLRPQDAARLVAGRQAAAAGVAAAAKYMMDTDGQYARLLPPEPEPEPQAPHVALRPSLHKNKPLLGGARPRTPPRESERGTQQLFDKLQSFDVNHNGFIDSEEFKKYLQAVGAWNTEPAFTDERWDSSFPAMCRLLGAIDLKQGMSLAEFTRYHETYRRGQVEEDFDKLVTADENSPSDPVQFGLETARRAESMTALAQGVLDARPGGRAEPDDALPLPGPFEAVTARPPPVPRGFLLSPSLAPSPPGRPATASAIGAWRRRHVAALVEPPGSLRRPVTAAATRGQPSSEAGRQVSTELLLATESHVYCERGTQLTRAWSGRGSARGADAPAPGGGERGARGDARLHRAVPYPSCSLIKPLDLPSQCSSTPPWTHVQAARQNDGYVDPDGGAGASSH
jgi:hypothetical protein